LLSIIYSSVGEQPLAVLISEHQMTFAQVQRLLLTTEYNGYPVVQTRQQPYLTGFVTRNDLRRAIGKCFIEFLLIIINFSQC
jgi:hypothetical protein